MWEKIKNILFRNLNMSFGLSGKNVFAVNGDTIEGEWVCIQILTPTADMSLFIDGNQIYLPDYVGSSNTTGLMIYGRITAIDSIASGCAARLYAGSNLGL